MIDLELIQKYLIYIVFAIQQLFESKKIQIVIIGSLFVFTIFYNKYLSKEARNINFKNEVQRQIESDPSILFSNIMKNNVIHFVGKDINISLFWEHLLKVDLEIAKRYNNKVVIKHVVVNHEPSWAYQLSGNSKNDNKLKQMSELVSEEERQKRFKIIKNRRALFDANPRIDHLSVYCKDGVNQKQFEDNVKNSNGKIKGFKLNNCSLIKQYLRGTFTIIKLNTGAIILFIEYNGEQTFASTTAKQNKQLIYFYCDNKKDIIKFDKNLYDLMYIVGLLDEL